MSESQPLLTVAMPVYNAGQHLRLAVLSVLHQSETNWELLIIDDGSTDQALASIKDIIDPRIRILNDGTNKGLAQRLNEAIDLARGKFYARMDQDDVSYPERFASQLQALRDNPALDLVATRAILIDENNRAIGMFPAAIVHEEICAKPWQGFYMPHPSWLGRTEWFRKYRYASPAPFCSEDQELLLRSYRDSKFAVTKEILFAYRIVSKANLKKLIRTRLAILKFQSRFFIRMRNFNYLSLAIILYLLKIIRDLYRWNFVRPLYKTDRNKNKSAFLLWERVFHDLINEDWRL